MKDTYKDFVVEFFARFGYAEWKDEVVAEQGNKSYIITTFTIESFHDINIKKLAQLARDVVQIEEEEKLRNKYPTLKHAYEEYQLLLKLSK